MTQRLAIASPVGPLTLEADGGCLTAIRFGGMAGTSGAPEMPETSEMPEISGMLGISGMPEISGMPGAGIFGMSRLFERSGMPEPAVCAAGAAAAGCDPAFPLGRHPGIADGPAAASAVPADAVRNDDTPPLLQEAARQLAAYFAGRLRRFELPLRPAGTPFQQRVWAALCEIPYGEVRSYGAIAARIGAPKAARAVGRANHGNPLPIVIPCHRVIGASGALTGYGGGLPIKEYLLRIEGYRLR